MSVNISDKAIILTDHKNLEALIKDFLPQINIDQYSENGSLSSLSSMKSRILEAGDLSFLKKDLLSFIQQNGYPFIISDMKINTGLDTDKENLKVLKNLLISYIIIMQSDQFKNISCNLIILSDKNNYNHFKMTYKQPQDILGILNTNDERLNNIIQDYIDNNEKFKKNFNILLTDADQDPSLIKSEIILFINMIKSKERLKSKLYQEKPAAVNGPRTEAAQSADVILRSGNIMYKNGESPSDYNEGLNLTEKEVFILGTFTSYTRLEVIQKLIKLMKTGFGSEINFKKGETLILNIPEGSVIDSTTPITLAQLISKELLEYKNIKIKVTLPHYQIMKNSQGFNMIQKNIIIGND